MPEFRPEPPPAVVDEPPPVPEVRPGPSPAVVFEPPPAPAARVEPPPTRPAAPPSRPAAPSALDAPAVPPAFSAPPTTPTPSFTPATWTVLVASDRGYYDSMKAMHSMSGPDVAFPPHTPERRIPLVGKQMRIGRRSAARELQPEIDLAEPPVDPGISRLHAVLVAAPDGTWSLLDSGSANGTFLNDRKIAIGDLVALREGDRINLGAWTAITVHRG